LLERLAVAVTPLHKQAGNLTLVHVHLLI
jgi:hypothetical protein